MRKLLKRVFAVVAVASLLGASAAAKQQFIEGVFTATESGPPIELIAWAEPRGAGILKVGHGFMEDAPVLPRTYRFLVNVSGFRIAGVLAVKMDVFKESLDHIEHAMLPFSAVQLNVRTVEVGIPELEDWNKVLRLRKRLKAADDKPVVFFLVLDNGMAQRYYPFFIDRQ